MLHVIKILYFTLCYYITYINSESDVRKILLFQTLTGKEIEIDIEPTDKVHSMCNNTLVCAFSTVLTPILCSISVKMKVERIKERVEEKEGIPPQQQRLIYSGKQM